ncbi:MAG: hypothetical protein AAB551_01765 [Patescibacteria group bacterium]
MTNTIGQFPDSWTMFTTEQKALLAAESFNFERPADAELALITDEGVRRGMTRIFDRLDGTRTPEQSEFLTAIESQFAAKLAVWTERFLINAKNLPTVEGLTNWLASLSGETLDGLREFGAQKLVLVPPEKAVALLRAIDANKTIPDQTDSKNWWPEFWDTVGSEKWKFGITKAVKENPLDESILYADFPTNENRRINEQMVTEYKKRFAEKGVGIMPPHGYVPAMAGQIAEGEVLDRNTWNAFERPAGAQDLPNAGWDGDRVVLGRSDPGNSYGSLRCLPWVEGEMET